MTFAWIMAPFWLRYCPIQMHFDSLVLTLLRIDLKFEIVAQDVIYLRIIEQVSSLCYTFAWIVAPFFFDFDIVPFRCSLVYVIFGGLI